MRSAFVAPALVTVAGLVSLCGAAKADSISLTSNHDNTMYADETGFSNGAGTTMFAGRTGSAGLRRALLSFDLSLIPAGSTVTGVTLTMRMGAAASPGLAADVALHTLLASWGEGTSVSPGGGGQGIAATPGDATWLARFFPGTAWANAGGDFAVSASASTSVTNTGFYTWSSAAMIADVQGWLSNPAANFGWLIRGDESAAVNAKRFDTREATTPSNRPRLTVQYTVPAPGAGAGAVVLAFGVFRRRR